MKINKKIIASVASIAIFGSIAIGSTYALFTSKDETNVSVTAGKVKLVSDLSNLRTYSGVNIVGDPALDTQWTDDLQGSFVNGGTASIVDGSTLILDRLMPGDKVVFDLTTKNESNVSIKWRYSYQVSNDNGLANGLKIYFDGVSTPVSRLRKNSLWATLSTPDTKVHEITIVLPSDKGNEYQDKTCNINFKVEAVQANALTKDVEYEVATKDDLLSLRDIVNSGVDFTGHTITMTNNIDMDGIDWSPVGTTANPFKGTFDGDGHKISNLKRSESFADTQFGLFGVTQGTTNSVYNSLDSVWQNETFVYDSIASSNYTTVIKNVELEGVDYVNESGSSSNRYTGGLVGACYNTYIENVKVSGSIKGVKGVGGIVGALEGSVISSCTNNATILATGYNVGGLVGGANYLSSVGYNAIVKSLNKGNVTTSIDNGYAGGILGMGQGYQLTVINDCENNGNINALAKSDCLGGIVGFGLHTGLVNECVNTGSISANSDIGYVGGIVGKGAGKIYNSINKGNITISADYLTGIFAHDTNEGGKQGFIKNCSNIGTLSNNKPEGKTYALAANCKSNIIVNKTFSNVAELNQLIASNDISSIELVGCSVTDNSGTLVLNSSVSSVKADSKICSRVDCTSANQTSLLIDIPDLTMNITDNYTGSLAFAGTNNIISIDSGVSVGSFSMTGNNQQFVIAGNVGRLSLSSTGEINGEIASTGVTGPVGFANTGTYVLTNRGLITHNGGGSAHTVSTITACTITIHNYGTIEAKKNAGGSCAYTCLFYNNCVVKVHQYVGSAITAETPGMTLACGSAQSVIYYIYNASGTITDTKVYK